MFVAKALLILALLAPQVVVSGEGSFSVDERGALAQAKEGSHLTITYGNLDFEAGSLAQSESGWVAGGGVRGTLPDGTSFQGSQLRDDGEGWVLEEGVLNRGGVEMVAPLVTWSEGEVGGYGGVTIHSPYGTGEASLVRWDDEELVLLGSASSPVVLTGDGGSLRVEGAIVVRHFDTSPHLYALAPFVLEWQGRVATGSTLSLSEEGMEAWDFRAVLPEGTIRCSDIRFTPLTNDEDGESGWRLTGVGDEIAFESEGWLLSTPTLRWHPVWGIRGESLSAILREGGV
ncbi:hypothetical protein H8D30_07085 [bacterium]|nr:hypothetical protein [bacterium]